MSTFPQSEPFLVKSILGVDPETGLDRELRLVSINISAENKTITVGYIIVLSSPTGVAVKELERGYYERVNNDTIANYDRLAASPVADGIRQLLSIDLPLYPNF